MQKVNLSNFYHILVPRPAVIITTIDGAGNVNVAPFSFVMPISMQPPLLCFAATQTRHTLHNVRKTKEFVVNIAPQEILDKLWLCAKNYPEGTDELSAAGLSKASSSVVSVPGIAECVAHIECVQVAEYELGDHVLVVGEVKYVQASCIKEDMLDIEKVKPLLHVGGRYFSCADKLIEVKI